MQESCMVHEGKVPIWKGECEGSKVEYIYSSPVLSPVPCHSPLSYKREEAVLIVDDLQVKSLESVGPPHGEKDLQ